MQASDCPNSDYAQLAALGRYFETHPAGETRPLRPAVETPPAEPVDRVDAAECPNTEYAQLAALGRMFEAQRRQTGS